MSETLSEQTDSDPHARRYEPAPAEGESPAERTYLNPLTGDRETWDVKWARVCALSRVHKSAGDPYREFVPSQF